MTGKPKYLIIEERYREIGLGQDPRVCEVHDCDQFRLEGKLGCEAHSNEWAESSKVRLRGWRDWVLDRYDEMIFRCQRCAECGRTRPADDYLCKDCRDA